MDGREEVCMSANNICADDTRVNAWSHVCVCVCVCVCVHLSVPVCTCLCMCL